MTEALLALSAFVGDVEARGGLEHLSETSRALILRLQAGLGAALFDLVAELEALEADLQRAPDEHWPMGDVRPPWTPPE